MLSSRDSCVSLPPAGAAPFSMEVLGSGSAPGAARDLEGGVKQQIVWMVLGQSASQWQGQASGGSGAGRPGNRGMLGSCGMGKTRLELSEPLSFPSLGAELPRAQQAGLHPGAHVRHLAEQPASRGV